MIRLEDIDAGNWRVPLSVSKEQVQSLLIWQINF